MKEGRNRRKITIRSTIPSARRILRSVMRSKLRRNRIKRLLLITCLGVLGGLVTFWYGWQLPAQAIQPVVGATSADWNPDSFWYHPWGQSGVHKGVDIFAEESTPVVAATGGVVLHQGWRGNGGKTISILGPKWRIHYYAHLSSIEVKQGMRVKQGQHIGAVGSTGNAKGKPPHLHYTVRSLVPLFGRATSEPQGHKKIWFLDPLESI